MQCFSSHKKAVGDKLKRQFEKAKSAEDCSNYMTIHDGGRIGNQMCQYVSLLGIAARLGFRPVISETMRTKLGQLFPYVSTISINKTK